MRDRRGKPALRDAEVGTSFVARLSTGRTISPASEPDPNSTSLWLRAIDPSNGGFEVTPPSTTHVHVQRMLAEIDQHYADRLSLSTLATALGRQAAYISAARQAAADRGIPSAAATPGWRPPIVVRPRIVDQNVIAGGTRGDDAS
jgi:hypothetical protein